MGARVCLVCAALASCAAPLAPVNPAADLDVAEVTPEARKHGVYRLHYHGAAIGIAEEEVARRDGGLTYRRREQLRTRRGGTTIDTLTRIRIDADPSFKALRIEWHMDSGALQRGGIATRNDDDSWHIAVNGEPERDAPAQAVPIELIRWLDERDTYQGPVLLAGYGFALADLSVTRSGRTAHTRLSSPFGAREGVVKVDSDGQWSDWQHDGLEAERVPAGAALLPHAPPELLESGVVPLSGAPSRALELSGVRRPPPPEMPGQRVEVRPGGWRVWFAEPGTPPSAATRAQLAAVLTEVNARLRPALDAPGANATTALELGRGDCSAYAALFASLMERRGVETRLVTGYRISAGRLVPHRWVSARMEGGWVVVDPTFGEAPIPPASHLALAEHGASFAETALADELAFAGTSGASARYR